MSSFYFSFLLYLVMKEIEPSFFKFWTSVQKVLSRSLQTATITFCTTQCHHIGGGGALSETQTSIDI